MLRETLDLFTSTISGVYPVVNLKWFHCTMEGLKKKKAEVFFFFSKNSGTTVNEGNIFSSLTWVGEK